MLGAKSPDLTVDLVSHLPRLLDFFLVRAAELRRIGKRPVQPRRHAGKNRATLCFGFIANGDHVREQFSRPEDIKDGLSFVFRNVDPCFTKDFDRERIEFARLEAGALGLERFAAPFVEQCRRHLTARAVVDANEKDLLFHWRLIRAHQQTWFLFLVRNEIVDLALGDGDVHPNVGEIVKSDHIA